MQTKARQSVVPSYTETSFRPVHRQEGRADMDDTMKLLIATWLVIEGRDDVLNYMASCENRETGRSLYFTVREHIRQSGFGHYVDYDGGKAA